MTRTYFLLYFLPIIKQSIVLSTIKQIAAEKKQPTSRKYNQLNNVKKSVQNNSMGEKMVTSRSLGDIFVGNVSKVNVFGSCDRLRRTWTKQPSRTKTTSQSKSYPKTLLSKIPAKFGKKIYKNIEFPQFWSPKDEHYFDMRRSVRIGRTLLDMRFASQQDVVQSVLENRGPAQVQAIDMPSLLVLYFERNFGGASLNVAHQKVVYFLEACLQYAEIPLMNFLRRCLVAESDDQDFVTAEGIWVYVETKNLMLSRNMIDQADIVPVGLNELDGGHSTYSRMIILFTVKYVEFKF
jgi:hypothetical protein